MTKQTWKIDEWNGCYPSSWKGLIVPDAMAHPAKFSSRLIQKIYAHLAEQGWVKAGDCVVDPFGGVALGGLEAARRGLNWYGVELEEKFWKLGNENIAMWEQKFGAVLKGSVHLANGDSRKLREVLGLERWVTVVTSPPYEESIKTSERGSGIDYSKSKSGGKGRTAGREAIATGYGSTPGQLGRMKGGNFDVMVSSPPYSAMQVEKNAKSINRTKQYEAYKKSGGGQTFEQFCRTQDIHSQGYGNSEGQLANMPVGGADDFWMAARQIVEEVYAALEPGGHAVWVVKDYVKNKERVPFCDQWRQLCEAVGFVTVHEHHALLVRNKRVQHTLEGGTVTMQSESKSFFRRLAEKNGSPRIDWETVWCMEKQ